MDLGIMELTAVEDWLSLRPALSEDQPPTYEVYFRSEYFGRIPERLLPAVREAMATAGGYDFQPQQRTITALYAPRFYAPMCREIVGIIQGWMTGEINLSK